MKTIIIGDVTTAIEKFISTRGLVKYYHLPKKFIGKVFSLPAIDNYFLENPDGVVSFCEIAFNARNISNIIVDVAYLETLSKELKENLFLYFDIFAEYCAIHLVSDDEYDGSKVENLIKRKVFFTNVKDINDLKIIGFDSFYPQKQVSIFGSCVSRDVVEISNNLTPCAIKLDEYIARNSMAALLSGAIDYSDSDIDLTSPFLKKCIHHDLKKTALKSLMYSLSGDSFLIIDFMDERFDVLNFNGRFITNSWDFRATHLAKKFNQPNCFLKFESTAKLNLWEKGFDIVYREVVKTLSPRNIVVIIPPMAAIMYGENGFSRFENNKYAISQYNEMLCIMNDHLERNYSGITLVKPLPWMLFCDYRHKWGAHPYHYNNYLYLYFSRLIKKH
ncbi:DUF6270 domain-containing protein [Cronobacter universalis]|uniref:DUF6270 domain-containing protein n=1 Tax=Cronobacter universalis TaxID=535744 RepID=UPI003CF8B25E